MKTSSYKKVHRDVLLEWVYDDVNNITEPFSILKNNRDRTKSYIGSTLTNNGIGYQLFPLDRVQNKYAQIDLSTYNFLNKTDYTSQGPLRHDQLNIRMPNNFNFEQYLGFHIRVYTYDFDHQKTYDLSNFFFNKNDAESNDVLDTVAPPTLYEDRLWDQIITVEIPSVNTVSSQLTNSAPTPGSVNDVLTGGRGLSLTSPIFIDFYWIESINTVGTEVQYTMTNPFSIDFPQSPELEQLTLFAEESSIGDYFEIYPLYNGSFNDYLSFMSSSKSLGNVYYQEYLITIFEENIKGKTTQFLIEKEFGDKVEWRPIIKYSTSNAVIDIEMRLVDKVDNSVVIRKALYGLKPQQTSKYALNLKKIKIRNVNKPKIYIKRSLELAEIDSMTRRNPQELSVTVDSPALVNLNNISAFSNNALNHKKTKKIDNYFSMGRLKILIEPFDNIIRFVLARKDGDKLEFIDLTNCDNLKLSFKSELANYEFELYPEPNMNSVSGMCSFKIPTINYMDLKKLIVEGENLFYITTTNKNVRTVLYSGQFNTEIEDDGSDTGGDDDNTTSSIINDPNLEERGIAIVTRRRVRVGTESELKQPIKLTNLTNLTVSKNKFNLNPLINLLG